MSNARILVQLFEFQSYAPLIIFFPKKLCTSYNSVPGCHIFMKLYMKVYKVKTITVTFPFWVIAL